MISIFAVYYLNGLCIRLWYTRAYTYKWTADTGSIRAAATTTATSNEERKK